MWEKVNDSFSLVILCSSKLLLTDYQVEFSTSCHIEIYGEITIYDKYNDNDNNNHFYWILERIELNWKDFVENVMKLNKT